MPNRSSSPVISHARFPVTGRAGFEVAGRPHAHAPAASSDCGGDPAAEPSTPLERTGAGKPHDALPCGYRRPERGVKRPARCRVLLAMRLPPTHDPGGHLPQAKRNLTVSYSRKSFWQDRFSNGSGWPRGGCSHRSTDASAREIPLDRRSRNASADDVCSEWKKWTTARKPAVATALATNYDTAGDLSVSASSPAVAGRAGGRASSRIRRRLGPNRGSRTTRESSTTRSRSRGPRGSPSRPRTRP